MRSNKGLEYWKKKARKRAERSFGPGAIPVYAVGILDRLQKEESNVIEGCDLQQIADRFNVPLKMRALASTIGVVRLDAEREGPIRVVLQRDKLGKSKASARLSRVPIGQTLRRQLLAADRLTCSYCQEKTSRLHIDHIIPLSLLGADEPGNWVALCASCNRNKWQHFETGDVPPAVEIQRRLRCYTCSISSSKTIL